MLNEDCDDMFWGIEEQKLSDNQDLQFPGELEDDVEVFFMMMLGLG